MWLNKATYWLIGEAKLVKYLVSYVACDIIRDNEFEMIVALNEAIAKKMTLLKKPIQQLRQEEREIVYAWRSQVASFSPWLLHVVLSIFVDYYEWTVSSGDNESSVTHCATANI